MSMGYPGCRLYRQRRVHQDGRQSERQYRHSYHSSGSPHGHRVESPDVLWRVRGSS
jgi:hypothetical protein